MKEMDPQPYTNHSHLGLGWGSLWGEDFIGNMRGLGGGGCRMVIFQRKYEGNGGGRSYES